MFGSCLHLSLKDVGKLKYGTSASVSEMEESRVCHVRESHVCFFSGRYLLRSSRVARLGDVREVPRDR